MNKLISMFHWVLTCRQTVELFKEFKLCITGHNTQVSEKYTFEGSLEQVSTGSV